MWKLAAGLAAVMSLALTASAQATVTTYDSFTEFTNGVLLENHTGETGASWSRHPSFPGTALTINNERVWGSQGGLYMASGIPTNNEYSVIAHLEVLTNSGATAVVGRVSTTSPDYYRGGYNAATGKWELVKCIGTTCTVLADSPAVLPPGTTYGIQLQLLNSRKTLFADGVAVATSTDNSITGTGRAGIRTGPGVVTSTTGYQVDEFEVYSEADTTITGGPSGPTSSTTATFSFTSTPTGGTFECDFDSFPEDNFAPCSSPISYPGLGEGTHTFRVRSTVAGTTDTTPATRTFTVDTTAPNTTITSGPSGATNNPSPSFAFTSSEGGSTFECRLDGPGATTGVYSACPSPKAYSGLAQGSYTLNVRAKDAAGNLDASPATRAFTVDTTAPNTTINSGPSGTIGSSSASFGFGSPDGGTTFQCRLDGPGSTTGVYAACTSPKSYTSLADGSYTFNVRATDAAGNQDASAATQAFTVSVGTVVWKADAELPMDQEWASACIEDGNPFGWRTNDPALFTDASPSVATFVGQEGTSPPPAQGLKSWRLTVNDGDFCGNDGGTPTTRTDNTCPYKPIADSCDSERAELAMENPGRTDMTNRLFSEGEDRWISWQLYLPAGFPVSPSSWQSILQWKQVGGLGTPVLNMDAQNGLIRLVNSDTRGNTNGEGTTLGSVTAVTGRWVKFTLHVKFSPDPLVGSVELYSDAASAGNVVKVPLIKTNTYTMKIDSAGNTVKSHARIGIYRDRPINGTVSAYYDGYTVATGRGAAEANAFGP